MQIADNINSFGFIFHKQGDWDKSTAGRLQAWNSFSWTPIWMIL